MIEVRSSGDGMGNGVFATDDIPKGARILAEAPLILLLSSPKPFDQFRRVVNLLTANQLHILDGLHCNLQLLDVNFASNVIEAVRGQGVDESDTLTLKRYAVYKTNCVAVTRSHQTVGTAVFSTYSRINHSCVPNAYNTWNEKISRETVHAGQDIKAGSQIFISYLASKGTFMNRERRGSVLSSWGFQCRCSSCLGTVATDAVREQMHDLDLELTSNLSQSGFLHPKERRALVQESIKQATTLLKLMEGAGLGGWTLCLVYRDCAESHLKDGRRAQAIAYAKKNLEIQRAIFGPEDLDTDWIGGIGLDMSDLLQ